MSKDPQIQEEEVKTKKERDNQFKKDVNKNKKTSISY